MSDLESAQRSAIEHGDRLIKAKFKISELKARNAQLVEALKDAQVAVELLAGEIEDNQCDGVVYDPTFDLCGHIICQKVGCIAWKVGSIEQALAGSE